MTTPPGQPDFISLLMREVDKAISKVRKEQPAATSAFFGLLDSLLSPPAPAPAPAPYDDPRAPSPHVAHPPDTAAEAQAQSQFDARRQNTEETSRLPSLRAGIYRHFRNGDLYQVLGYAKDAAPPTHDPDRINVVYLSLKPTTAGHSMFTRPVQYFFQQVCKVSGKAQGSCTVHLIQSDCPLVDRFTYVGPEYRA